MTNAVPRLTVVGRGGPAETKSDTQPTGGIQLTLRNAKYEDGTLDLTRVRLSVAQVLVVATLLLSAGGVCALTLYRIHALEQAVAAIRRDVSTLTMHDTRREARELAEREVQP